MLGQIVTLLTFPGVVAHEIGHMFFCKRFNIKIYKVCYFRFGNPAGYVIHEEPQNFKQSFFVDVGPFIVSNVFAIIAFVLAVYFMNNIENLGFFFGWLGVSFAMHSFPSKEDAKSLWSVTKKHSQKNSVLKLIGYPFVIIIYMANLLSFFWFDLIWAFLLYQLVKSII